MVFLKHNQDLRDLELKICQSTRETKSRLREVSKRHKIKSGNLTNDGQISAFLFNILGRKKIDEQLTQKKFKEMIRLRQEL